MAAPRKQGQGTTNRGNRGTNNRTGTGDAMYAAGQHFGDGLVHSIQQGLGPNWPAAGLTGQNIGTTNMPARAKRGGRKQSQAQI